MDHGSHETPEILPLGPVSLTPEAKELTKEIYKWIDQKLAEGKRPISLMMALKTGALAASDPKLRGLGT